MPQPKSLLQTIRDASTVAQGVAALLTIVIVVTGFFVTRKVLSPGPTITTNPTYTVPSTGVSSSSTTPPTTPPRWQQLAADQVTTDITGDDLYRQATQTSVTIAGQVYSDATSSTLSVTDIADASPLSIDVGFALSKRYSGFKVVFGIPDNAACCPMPVLTYSIDSGPESTPVTLQLGQPDPIDVPVTGASRLDVHLVFTGGWTAAFGGAQGLTVAH